MLQTNYNNNINNDINTLIIMVIIILIMTCHSSSGWVKKLENTLQKANQNKYKYCTIKPGNDINNKTR